MDDHVNPLLFPLTPGFATGRFVGVCGGLYRQYFPSWWGIVIFRNANPHLPPPQPVPGVVGHYIDRCIIHLFIFHRLVATNELGQSMLESQRNSEIIPGFLSRLKISLIFTVTDKLYWLSMQKCLRISPKAILQVAVKL